MSIRVNKLTVGKYHGHLSKSGAARRRETAALQRAMELAMGVDVEKGSVKGAGGDPHRLIDRGGLGGAGDGSVSADEV